MLAKKQKGLNKIIENEKRGEYLFAPFFELPRFQTFPLSGFLHQFLPAVSSSNSASTVSPSSAVSAS
jgi:hypothetical protein